MNYYTITSEMIDDLHLSGNELLVYALINNFTQFGSECKFTGSLQYICKLTAISRRTAIEVIKRLCDKGLIIKEDNVINGVIHPLYYTNAETARGVQNLHGGSAEIALVGGAEFAPNNKYINNKYNNIILKEKNNKKESLNLYFVSFDFKEAFALWLNYKRERGQAYKQKGAEICYKKLLELSNKEPKKAMQIVEQSIANNYQGLFPIKNNKNENNGRNYQTATERLREEYRSSIEKSMRNIEQCIREIPIDNKSEKFPF